MALKEENLKLKNKKIKKYTNRKLYTFLFASIFIYAFFFLSNLFMPPTFEGVETLKIGSSVEMESRKLTFITDIFLIFFLHYDAPYTNHTRDRDRKSVV